MSNYSEGVGPAGPDRQGAWRSPVFLAGTRGGPAITPAAPQALEAAAVDKADRLLIIVPCLNEAESIGRLLGELAEQAPFADVLVVDDGSTDDTHLMVTAPARAVRLPVNLGIGGAVQTGIKYAERNGYGRCLQVDGDGQHPPGEVRRLMAAMDKGGAQLVIGSRYLTGEGFQSSAMRRLGGRVIGLALRSCFGGRRRVSDPTSGFRLMDRRAIEFFARHYPTDFPEPISIAWALARGMRVEEVPVQMRERQGGVSSIRMMKTISYMVRVVSYVLLARATILPGRA